MSSPLLVLLVVTGMLAAIALVVILSTSDPVMYEAVGY